MRLDSQGKNRSVVICLLDGVRSHPRLIPDIKKTSGGTGDDAARTSTQNNQSAAPLEVVAAEAVAAEAVAAEAAVADNIINRSL